MIELVVSALQDTGIGIFLSSAVIGAVIGVVIQRFNVIYIATHEVQITINIKQLS